MKYYIQFIPKAVILVVGLIFGYLIPAVSHAELRKFEMTIDEMEINVAPGLKSKVWAFNGQVPGPLIHVKEGDDVEVTVYNNTALREAARHQYKIDGWKATTSGSVDTIRNVEIIFE